MIRILLPTGMYNDARIRLVERICQLQRKWVHDVHRAYAWQEMCVSAHFLEGFLENEKKLEVACLMLSDHSKKVIQSDSSFPDMKTILIEDMDDVDEAY